MLTYVIATDCWLYVVGFAVLSLRNSISNNDLVDVPDQKINFCCHYYLASEQKLKAISRHADYEINRLQEGITARLAW